MTILRGLSVTICLLIITGAALAGNDKDDEKEQKKKEERKASANDIIKNDFQMPSLDLSAVRSSVTLDDKQTERLDQTIKAANEALTRWGQSAKKDYDEIRDRLKNAKNPNIALIRKADRLQEKAEQIKRSYLMQVLSALPAAQRTAFAEKWMEREVVNYFNNLQLNERQKKLAARAAGNLARQYALDIALGDSKQLAEIARQSREMLARNVLSHQQMAQWKQDRKNGKFPKGLISADQQKQKNKKPEKKPEKKPDDKNKDKAQEKNKQAEDKKAPEVKKD